MRALIVEEVDSFPDLLTLEHEWRHLEQQAQLEVPFFTFDWAASWWAHFRESKRSLKDQMFTRAIRTPAGQLVAVAPMMRTERPAVGPVRLRVVQFFGADPNVTELRGMLAAPEHALDAQLALLTHLQGNPAAWDWVQWAGVPASSPREAQLEATGALEWQRDVPCYLLPLEKTWEAQRAKLKHNIKESLRKCYNSLKRDGHAFRLEVVRARGEVYAALERFFALHGARAEAASTVQHLDVFSSPAAKSFLVDVCERFAERELLRLFELKIEGRVVASRIGFAFGRSLYLYYSGYDPAWARYSVMTTTVAEAIKHAISEGFETVNLSTGTDVSKTRWGPREVVYREGLLRSEERRGQLALEAYRYALRTSEHPRLREWVERFLERRRSS